MSAIDTKFYEKKKRNSFYLAVGCFLGVLLISGGIFAYNIFLENKISSLSRDIEKLESSITQLQEQSEIQAYTLYDKNKALLDTQSCESRVTSFITHLKRNTGKYSLSATGFDYSQGTIQTEISVSSDENAEAYQKIVSFLNNYPQEENALFDILPIEDYDGFDRISISPSFNLNQTMYENCRES